MAPEDEVQGKADIKRDNSLQLADFLWRQLDTQRSDVGEQIGDFALPNKRENIWCFMQEVRNTLPFSLACCLFQGCGKGAGGTIPEHGTTHSSSWPYPPTPPTTSHHSPTMAPSSHLPVRFPSSLQSGTCSLPLLPMALSPFLGHDTWEALPSPDPGNPCSTSPGRRRKDAGRACGRNH